MSPSRDELTVEPCNAEGTRQHLAPSDASIVAPTDAQLEQFIRFAGDFGTYLTNCNFTASGLFDVIGPAGLAALDSGDPEVVASILRKRRKANGHSGDVDLLIGLLIVGDATALPTSLPEWLADKLIACGIVRETSPGLFVPGIDVRPISVDTIERLIFSDRDASMTVHVPGADHVLGAGRASRSLLDITPMDETGKVLDLGAGCGVQALGQYRANSVIATDIHPRANLFARITFAANGVTNCDVREGSWFEPVAGELFDRIIANPPFVVGLPTVEHVYRDSGLNLDGATELMLRQVPQHLKLGGTAHLLGAWVHREGQSWQQRLAHWLPDDGVEVWITQRDVASPSEYISTWLRDESIDPRTAAGRKRARDWIEHFESEGVVGVGFGYITIQKIDGPSSVLCEEMPQPLAGAFAPEAAEYLARAEWLRGKDSKDILDAGFQVRPGVAVERVSIADSVNQQGFEEFALRLSRTDGPRWSHDIDDELLRVLSALHPSAALSSVVDIMAMLGAIDEDSVEETKQALVPIVVDLVRHGLLVPADFLD